MERIGGALEQSVEKCSKILFRVERRIYKMTKWRLAISEILHILHL